MRRTVLALGVSLVYGLALVAAFGGLDALAAGGANNSNPIFVINAQVNGRDFKVVSCTTAGDVAAVTAAEGTNAQSILFQNDNPAGGNGIILCPRVAAAGACDSDDKGIDLDARANLIDDVSVSSAPWSCKGLTGTGRLKVYIQRDLGSLPGPTPTAIPTQTPTPTP